MQLGRAKKPKTMLLGATVWTVRFRAVAQSALPLPGEATARTVSAPVAPAAAVQDLSTAMVANGLLDSSRAAKGPVHWYKLSEWLQVRLHAWVGSA